jgi:hypothetical protein
MIKEILIGMFGVYYGLCILLVCYSAYDEEWCKCMRWWKHVVRACGKHRDRHISSINICITGRFASAKTCMSERFASAKTCTSERGSRICQSCGCFKKYFKTYSIISQEEDHINYYVA